MLIYIGEEVEEIGEGQHFVEKAKVDEKTEMGSPGAQGLRFFFAKT